MKGIAAPRAMRLFSSFAWRVNLLRRVRPGDLVTVAKAA